MCGPSVERDPSSSVQASRELGYRDPNARNRNSRFWLRLSSACDISLDVARRGLTRGSYSNGRSTRAAVQKVIMSASSGADCVRSLPLRLPRLFLAVLSITISRVAAAVASDEVLAAIAACQRLDASGGAYLDTADAVSYTHLTLPTKA